MLEVQAEWTDFQETQRLLYPFPGEESLEFAELRPHLARTDALVGWFDLEIEGLPPESWTYVVRTDGVHWFAHTASGDRNRWSRSQAALGELRRQLHGGTWSALGMGASADTGTDAETRTETDGAAATTVLGEVSRDRWEIARSALGSAERIVVIGTGALDGVPVEALFTSGGESVIDRWTITTAPSASIHVWLAARSRIPHREPASLFAVADPLMGASPLDEVPWPAGTTLEPMLRGSRWTPVPESRREVRAISPFFPRTVIVVGADASEAELNTRLEHGELHDFDVLHFATHAYADDRRPDRSALVLAQVDLPDPLESLWSGPAFDGLLTAREILGGWSLDAELVVLSACESALGTRIRGEGFVGLTQSFLLAGSRNVLASLWAVDDEATRILMESFYRAWLLDGRPGPEALRVAKRSLRDLEVGGLRPYADPRYWAAFVWVGPGD